MRRARVVVQGRAASRKRAEVVATANFCILFFLTPLLVLLPTHLIYGPDLGEWLLGDSSWKARCSLLHARVVLRIDGFSDFCMQWLLQPFVGIQVDEWSALVEMELGSENL